jgi:prepilin-type N-terminal cleavage/methylation domain-containing protein
MRNRSGFTMIEMMIAVLVSSVVIGGLYSVFNLQSRQFVYQDLRMSMHQNLRFSTDMMTKSIRVAGFGTGGQVSGYSGASGDGSLLPVLLSWDGQGDGDTDAITVVYGDPGLRMQTKPVVATCDTETLEFDTTILDQDIKLAEYEANELLLCSDYANLMGIESYLWVITEVDTDNGTISVEDNTGYDDYLDLCDTSENLTPSMLCSKAHLVTFYIDAEEDSVGPGSAEHPVLMMDLDMGWPEADDVPLVDNIEDLQVEYCVETSGSGVDCTDDSNWDDSITASEGDDVWMVRLHILSRSSREDPQDLRSSTRPTLANHSGADSSDAYFRQVLVTEVAVRNLRLQANL